MAKTNDINAITTDKPGVLGLYIIVYPHRHGEDIFTVCAKTELEALTLARQQLEEQYSKEELDHEEEQYGALECRGCISRGDYVEYDGKTYRFSLQGVCNARIKTGVDKGR